MSEWEKAELLDDERTPTEIRQMQNGTGSGSESERQRENDKKHVWLKPFSWATRMNEIWVTKNASTIDYRTLKGRIVWKKTIGDCIPYEFSLIKSKEKCGETRRSG